MHIIKQLLTPLQATFSNTPQGQKRKRWFIYTLMACIVPFTSSITSNLIRSLQTLFGLKLSKQRFYTFMASSTLPWGKLWLQVWRLIPNPTTNGRIILALDDSINPKTGKKIFGCAHFHNHASQGNQSPYPWSQCIVAIGLLKKVKSRWACLPLSFRFYMMEKVIKEKSVTTLVQGKSVAFKTKMQQSADMIKCIYLAYNKPVLIVADSWFGNNGLWKCLEKGQDGNFNILSRLRVNNNLFDFPETSNIKTKGRPKSYGSKLGNVEECGALYKDKAKQIPVFLYGKQREIMVYSRNLMSKNLKREIKVVWVFRKARFVAFFTTDLSLSVEEIVEYYGARWKIESGFKELKQEIGSAKTQTRNSFAVENHLNFCMMASAFTWIYAGKLVKAPNRKHKIKGRSSFAFSDIRRIIAKEVLSDEFNRTFPVPQQTPRKSFINTLLKMVA